jgi:flagellar basal-body rod protein FlgB
MDRERASFAENSVKYEATLRFINSHVREMLDAMKSPSQG